jgi:hypothetical protein
VKKVYKKLVRYDGWHFVEVDPVRLQRKAIFLREQIQKKIPRDNDKYQFYTLTLPIVEAAIRREISNSLDEDTNEFVNANFKWDKREGTLPSECDREFVGAVSGFSVTVQGMSLEQTDEINVGGATFRWVNFEEETDWPDKMPFP